LSSGGHFEIEKKTREIEDLEKSASIPDFWNDNHNAKKVMSKITENKKVIANFKRLSSELENLVEFETLLKESGDESLEKELNSKQAELEREITSIDMSMKLSGQVDKNNAIVAIHAGAGGTESCDWAEILLRMYERWSEKKGFETEITDILPGEEAGIKSVTSIIKGHFAYGFMQSEIGVHRLVRISPFDSNKRRHTSFTSVDVIPEIEDDIDIIIEEKDIRIDTYRASGHGGQHVNKTDSAVRITHLPTGIVVQSQNERSQIKNRATSMKLLKARLYEFEQDKRRKVTEKHYDDKGSIAWGNQIRSYVFMPYQLVKDHRTGLEFPQIDIILDGDLDPFMYSYLDWKLKNSRK